MPEPAEKIDHCNDQSNALEAGAVSCYFSDHVKIVISTHGLRRVKRKQLKLMAFPSDSEVGKLSIGIVKLTLISLRLERSPSRWGPATHKCFGVFDDYCGETSNQIAI